MTLFTQIACELLGVKRVVPCHWGTFPLLRGRPEELAELVALPAFALFFHPLSWELVAAVALAACAGCASCATATMRCC